MSSQQKVFVTGASGFIGARLVEALVERGCQVRALSRRDVAMPGSVELVRGDITDLDSLRRGMEGCQQVFHLAAYAKNWARDPRTFYRMNVEGTRNVLTAAREHGALRVVWTSSVVTFGPTLPGVVGDETMPRTTPRYLTEY